MVILRVAFTIAIGSVMVLSAEQKGIADEAVERRTIISGPAVELATPTTAIIRWTVDIARGTETQYGIVRYGTDPGKLDHTASSPNSLVRSRPGMIYRVRIDQLTPGTTYYYTVDTAQADNVVIGLKSPVEQFTTPP